MVHGYADRWADLRGRCIFPAEQNRVCLNKGKYFVDVAPQVGWQAKGASRGVALANFDSHGSLDVLITKQFAPAMLYRNKTTQQKAWVGICLVGNGRTCNRDALGNKVIVAGPHGPQMREQVAANGFSAQSEHRLLFGLGGAKAIAPVAVTVDWCGRGPRQVFQLTANDYHRLEQK